uniref:DUF1279 domain-containing protein n=1 Tax=Corethron hystrix TaxID=216773 RepID=A0A7S1BW81_9STRA|mmetsp:Transcript_41047/g.96365  ORF Transcript_41047/g.96365 Transcript_41047/m.96365 type:complete len:248 (+) Transcript_41047:52-795(+)
MASRLIGIRSNLVQISKQCRHRHFGSVVTDPIGADMNAYASLFLRKKIILTTKLPLHCNMPWELLPIRHFSSGTGNSGGGEPGAPPTRDGDNCVVPAVRLSDDEAAAEKRRVGSMSDYAKTMELRRIDAQLERLNTMRAVHTGDHGTWKGEFKSLARDYGFQFMVYWTAVWACTGVGCYFALEMGGVDAISLLMRFDAQFGTDVASRIDPTLGNVAVAIAVNEMLEPIRLPFIVLTTKPVVFFFRNK